MSSDRVQGSNHNRKSNKEIESFSKETENQKNGNFRTEKILVRVKKQDAEIGVEKRENPGRAEILAMSLMNTEIKVLAKP